jgi:protein CpxP
MNAIRKSMMIALAAISLSAATAQAQPAAAGRHDFAAKAAEMKAKMAEHGAARQAKLHDALKITAAQEPAWAAFIAAQKPAAQAERPDHAAMAAMSSPERMEKMIAAAKARIPVMEARLASLKTFYAVLTAEQKAIFDKAIKGHMRQRGRHMMHG